MIMQLKNLSVLQISKALYNYIYDDFIDDENKIKIKRNFKYLVFKFMKKSKRKISLEDIYIILKFYNIQSYNYIYNIDDFEKQNNKINDFIVNNSYDFAFTHINPKFSLLDKNNILYQIKKIQCYIYNISVFSNDAKLLKKILNNLIAFYSIDYITSLKEYQEAEWG